MEMELFLREQLRETRFYHVTGTEQHRLTFVEELKNDGKEEVVCEKCNEAAIVGPTFKCRACKWLSHVSCYEDLDTSHRWETLCFHFGRRHDQLIFTEELKNDGKKGVICIACEEQVEDPGYKCSASDCNFHLHQSCAQLPFKINHPSHPNHILVLKRPQSNKSNCNACGKWCSECLFYRCNQCNFNLDITCATRARMNNIGDCQQHAFISFFKQIHLICEACGQEGKDFASLCTLCRLFIHSRCAGFPHTMITSRHDHTLTLTYSLQHQVKDFDDLFCKLCRQKVKIKYAAFYCQKCDFVAHLHCADAYRRKSLPEEFVDVTEKINRGEIEHFSHQHNLILSHEEVLHDKLCDGCMRFIISAPFYNCMQCKFFLHTTCAQLSRKKRHIFHRHTLTLLQRAPYTNGVFTCDACGHSQHGFVYICEWCGYHLDAQCCSIPEIWKHESHQHSISLALNSDKNCNACDLRYKSSKADADGVFVCTTCDFALGFECATLPLIARHKYDEHSLALTYVAEDKSEEYYCLICEKEIDPKHWFYYCAKCDFPAHRQCVLGKYLYIKFGSTYKDENHQHPITFVRNTGSSPPCDACGKTFDGMALECTQCKFTVHGMNSNCMQKISKKVLHL